MQFGENPKPNTEQKGQVESKEKEIDYLLSELPESLREKWQQEYDMTETYQSLVTFYTKLKDFSLKRKEVLENIDIFPGLSEQIKEEIRQVLVSIRNTFGDMNHFLGNGYTAEVYELPVAPHICVKYIADQNAYNENNHLRTEYDLLSLFNLFKVGDKVRTPKADFIRIHPSEGHQMGMEKVKGKSLSQIMEKPDQYQELINAGRLLDKDSLIKEATEFMEKAYKELGVVHNDLFARNLMLSEDGKLYIIDFGKGALKEVGNDREDEHKRDINCIKNELARFFKFLDNV